VNSASDYGDGAGKNGPEMKLEGRESEPSMAASIHAKLVGDWHPDLFKAFPASSAFLFAFYIHGSWLIHFAGGHGERERQKGLLTSYRNLN
jgi:hypothetical protein